jgi:hypothetical protein
VELSGIAKAKVMLALSSAGTADWAAMGRINATVANAMVDFINFI